jgi:hypothetical protein
MGLHLGHSDGQVKQKAAQKLCADPIFLRSRECFAMFLMPSDASLTPLPEIKALEAEITHLRERVFDLADRARQHVPHEMTGVHVALMGASNDLGEAERVLRDTGRI